MTSGDEPVGQQLAAPVVVGEPHTIVNQVAQQRQVPFRHAEIFRNECHSFAAFEGLALPGKGRRSRLPYDRARRRFRPSSRTAAPARAYRTATAPRTASRRTTASASDSAFWRYADAAGCVRPSERFHHASAHLRVVARRGIRRARVSPAARGGQALSSASPRRPARTSSQARATAARLPETSRLAISTEAVEGRARRPRGRIGRRRPLQRLDRLVRAHSSRAHRPRPGAGRHPTSGAASHRSAMSRSSARCPSTRTAPARCRPVFVRRQRLRESRRPRRRRCAPIASTAATARAARDRDRRDAGESRKRRRHAVPAQADCREVPHPGFRDREARSSQHAQRLGPGHRAECLRCRGRARAASRLATRGGEHAQRARVVKIRQMLQRGGTDRLIRVGAAFEHPIRRIRRSRSSRRSSPPTRAQADSGRRA